jgi:succinoglycan biosynthesis protein ExoA
LNLALSLRPLSFPSVSESLPVVTVIIPTRPGQSEVKSLSAARQLDYPKDKLEIIVARGRQPSVQRNTAIRASRGEIIYFLDDDSVPRQDNLQRAIKHFADPKVQMVGGPNVCPAVAPTLEKQFALVMGSPLAFFSSHARYTPVGSVRESGEKELILCNLLARRQMLTELGGFDESLYPNEENALMDAIAQRGGKLLYDPDLIVERRPRPTLHAFSKMLMTYGRGRAEQVRLHPTLGSLPNFVPPLLVVYLLASPFLPPLLLLPLVVYFMAVLVQAIALLTRGKVTWISNITVFILMCHICYGVGFWRGLFTKPKPPPKEISAEVALEKPQV